MTKIIQARTFLLIYIMMVYKVDDNDIPSDIDQCDNHLLPIDNLDLCKLIY